MPFFSAAEHNLIFPLPDSYFVWNLYGAGYDNLGINGKPERVPMQLPAEDQILVRIDAVGICYSDVKLIQQGGRHPKLTGIDLSRTPTRPGHEISLTVVRVGDLLQDQFSVGQRYAILPEIIKGGRKMTYGFNIAGGLSQYQLIGPELLETDRGECLLPLDDSLGYGEACLLEPWGSVFSSYDRTRRVHPMRGGRMWIIGHPGSSVDYTFSKYLSLPGTILLSGVSKALETEIKNQANNVLVSESVTENDYASLSDRYTGGRKFDDIVLLGPQRPEQIEALLNEVAAGGTINLVGKQPVQGITNVDAQRIHYDFVSLLGNSEMDIAASYGLEQNRTNFLEGGIAVMIGAAGPMGQMHLQYAITNPEGPQTIIAADINQTRLDYAALRYEKLAEELNKSFYAINPALSPTSFQRQIKEKTGSGAADDVIVLVPEQRAIDEAAALLHSNSMINVFAGTQAGISIPLDISLVYLGNLQISGSSGLSFKHMETVRDLARQGTLNINSSIAAVGGLEAAAEAIRAAEERRFPGKIIVYPQLLKLPLLSTAELFRKYTVGIMSRNEEAGWSTAVERKLLTMKFD